MADPGQDACMLECYRIAQCNFNHENRPPLFRSAFRLHMRMRGRFATRPVTVIVPALGDADRNDIEQAVAYAAFGDQRG